MGGTTARIPAARVAIGAGAVVLSAMVLMAAVVGALGGSLTSSPRMEGGSSQPVSALARRDIPSAFLSLYQRAAQRYGLDWAILAGIGKVECDHGRDPDPSCRTAGAVNSAGAGGPMQFISSTWGRFGVDGNGDGRTDRWDPADSIYGAANYLRASGAPGDYGRALLAYNHAHWYVVEVEAWADRYRGSPYVPSDQQPSSSGGGDLAGFQAGTPTLVRFISGQTARLLPGNGHVALVPTEVPATVQAMIVAGNELQGLSYGPGGHPDPRGSSEEDCSSSLNYILYRSGVRPIAEILADNPLAQDYARWGLPGPGRWVTIYATASPTPHVFVVIAHLRLDTSHNGTDVGPNSGEDGPRWRILDHIPGWAHWSVRHPPGL